MSAKEFHKMTIEQLEQELNDLLKEQFNLRMQKSSRQEIKPHLIRNARRNIARVKTILHQKQGDV